MDECNIPYIYQNNWLAKAALNLNETVTPLKLSLTYRTQRYKLSRIPKAYMSVCIISHSPSPSPLITHSRLTQLTYLTFVALDMETSVQGYDSHRFLTLTLRQYWLWTHTTAWGKLPGKRQINALFCYTLFNDCHFFTCYPSSFQVYCERIKTYGTADTAGGLMNWGQTDVLRTTRYRIHKFETACTSMVLRNVMLPELKLCAFVYDTIIC